MQLLVISPVRNEGAHIARVAAALAAQELTPARWIAIDDASEDDTYTALTQLSERLPWLTVLRAPPHTRTRDGLAEAVEVRSFNAALAHAMECDSPEHTLGTGKAPGHTPANSYALTDNHAAQAAPLPPSPVPAYTHVMKLDGDVELPPHYLNTLAARFAADPRLGIAGGVLVEAADGRPIAIPRHHVHGALKCYSRECLAAIGGVPERLAWDTIDETYARMAGFRTERFSDLIGVHHRPLASADGALRGHARHGRCAYITHYGPLWVTLRALKVATRPPRGASGAAFLYGYAQAAVRREPRVNDAAYRAFTRRELRARLRARARRPLAGAS